MYNEFQDEESGHFVTPLPQGVIKEECHYNGRSYIVSQTVFKIFTFYSILIFKKDTKEKTLLTTFHFLQRLVFIRHIYKHKHKQVRIPATQTQCCTRRIAYLTRFLIPALLSPMMNKMAGEDESFNFSLSLRCLSNRCFQCFVCHINQITLQKRCLEKNLYYKYLRKNCSFDQRPATLNSSCFGL